MSSRAMVAAAVFTIASYGDTPRTAVNADSAIMADFQKRVADYVQLRKDIEAHMPPLKSTASIEKIEHHERELGEAIQKARRNAKQGDVFTAEIAGEIRRLIGIAMKPDGAKISQSLRHAEPVQIHLGVNQRYPHHIPLQSTPPSLLENLPKLSPEMEYRVTGTDLVLLDTKANLIIDLIPGVFS